MSNNKIHAHHFPTDTLFKLNTRGEYGKHDDRERFENNCLKFYFGQKWQNGISKLEEMARGGNDIFLIPNYIPLNPDGANGIGADFISHAPALFAEIDDLSIGEQWEKIDQLKAQFGLEPTQVVFSGGKSLHIYFKLATPLTDLEQWKRLQRKLICVLKSDPAIANPNREMRLAGVARKSKCGFQSLELDRDISYSPEEIEAILDSTGKFPYGLDAERFRRWRREGDAVLTLTPEELNPPRPQRDERDFEVDRFGEAAPLEHFVTKHNQDLINSGASSDRNNQGLKLAKNLIATEERLSQLSIPFTGNAYDLFLDYCQRCPSGGGWNHREWEQVWRSAGRGNPSPSVPDDGLQKRAFFYQLQQNGGARYEQQVEAERDRLEALYGKEITRDEWLSGKASEWWEWITSKASDFKDLFNFSQGNYKVKEKGVSKKLILIYGKDPLPTPENAVKLPKIQFKKGDRLKLNQELIALGWGYVFESSHTGTGKSHDYNLITKDKDEEGKTQGKIWYLHGDHRNPTVEPAEKKADLPSRHNGLTQDHSRHTPAGEPFLRRWKWDEEKPHPDIPSNCPETDRFNGLATKGYNIHSAQTSEGEKKQNPICAQCPILHECIESGYKAQRQTVMEQSEVRAHPDSLPSPEEYGYGDDTLIWEEFSTLFKPTEARSLTKKDLDQQWESSQTWT